MDLNAQENSSIITSSLLKAGMKNIAVKEAGNVLYIAFENFRYRSDAKALAEVIKSLEIPIDSGKTIYLLLRKHHLGVLSVEFPASLLPKNHSSEGYMHVLNAARFSMNNLEAEKAIKGVQTTNPSFFNVDIPVGLNMRYLLGAFDYPVRIALDLLPSVDIDIAEGLSVQAQTAIPVYNDLDKNTNLRPGLMTITRDFVFPATSYSSLSFGFFSRNRTGVHATAGKLFYSDRISLGIDLGYTRFTNITGKVENIEREQKDYPVYLVNSSYRVRKYDLDIKVEAGRFLYQDDGFLFSVSRVFHETRIGFFAMSTTYGTNAGFSFSLAIPPRKYSGLRHVRIRPETNFSLSYRVVGGDRIARTYYTGKNIVHLLPDYYPSFISKELIHYLTK